MMTVTVLRIPTVSMSNVLYQRRHSMSNIYCTYLTTYSGNKLPPFYIGYTSIIKIKNGYRGSVSSKEYKNIWKKETKKFPHLFKTFIISVHKTQKEAVEREQQLQIKLNVLKNSLYTNKAIGQYVDNTGRKQSLETRIKKSVALKNKPKSEEHNRKNSESHKVQKPAITGKTYEEMYGIEKAKQMKEERRKRMLNHTYNVGKKNPKHSEFMKENHPPKDPKTGRFIKKID